MNRLTLRISNILIISIIYLVVSCNLVHSSDISVIPSAKLIVKFETLSFHIDLKCPFTNPYDPADIRVDVLIKTPNGYQIELPCFYKTGSSQASQWEARFTAMQTGKHFYSVRVICSQDTLLSKAEQVEVKESNKDGFLRLDPQSNYSFLFDSGKRFRGVGLNLGWELEPKWGDEKRYTYEMFFAELEKNRGNFFRTWMCPWNLPLEWTRVVTYEPFVDEYENWGKTFSHSSGLALVAGKTDFTEDDLHRVTIQSNSREALIYHLKDIKKFKIKIFYQKNLLPEAIKCSYSADKQSYSPIEIEFSQTWNTYEDWQRVFVASLAEFPAGTNYLKIEFMENRLDSLHLAGISIGYGQSENILDAPGLGKYYEKTAKRLDEILRLSEEKGFYIMLTHDYHGIFKPKLDRWGANDEWRRNPYNAANGGPCQTPEDFFTNTEAKQFYKNRLRYMVARWGYSTHLACWEFWNEIDNVMTGQNVSAAAIRSWHQEMADYLKQIDPYKHLVSTSVTYREIPGLWNIANLDFTQHHNYGPTKDMKKSILKYVETYGKPDVVGEFSLGWKGPGKDYPVELYEGELHNGIWRGLFSPTPILPMTWWWEWHYDQKQYVHFKTAADFIAMMLEDKKEFLQDLSVNSVNTNIETLGLKSGNNLFVWLMNANKEVFTDLTLNIPGTTNAKYRVKYYDTWTGSYSDEKEITAINGQFILHDLQLKSEHDMAIWLRAAEK